MYKFLRARRLWLVGCIACVLFGAAQAQSDVRRGFIYEVRKGNQSALLLKARLLFRKNTVVVSVPYHIEHGQAEVVGDPEPSD